MESSHPSLGFGNAAEVNPYPIAPPMVGSVPSSEPECPKICWLHEVSGPTYASNSDKPSAKANTII